MTNKELLDVVKMRLDGYTLAEIGEKYGMTGSGVSQAIKSISRRDPHGRGHGQTRMYDQIIYPNIRARMKERGWSMTTLANKTGISRQCLYKMLYGDTRRPKIASKKVIAQALDMGIVIAFREEAHDDA